PMTSPRPWPDALRPARRWGAAAVALGLAACAADKGPAPPMPTAMAPNRGPDDRPTAVIISGANFSARIDTDFQDPSQSSLEASYQARLGQLPLRSVKLGADGTLEAVVPEG